MTEHTHAEIYADIDRAFVRIKRLESRIKDLESKNELWFMFEEDNKEEDNKEEDNGDLTLWKRMIKRNYEK